MITVALPKGRTLGATLDRFARAGLVPEEDFSTTRKLIVPARGTQARFVLLKDPDVPLYVERGAADLGVCGLDHVLESGADLLVPVDLGFGACRLSLAAPRSSGLLQARDLGAELEVDLGEVRGLGYYTGLVFNLYTAGAPRAVGGGGRYDTLLGRFGDPRPAVGFSLDLDALVPLARPA